MKNYTTILLISIVSMLIGTCFGQQKTNEITEALAFMEGQVQKTSVVQCDRADGFYNDVRSEIYATKGVDQQLKRDKLLYVLERMDGINAETERFIAYVDQIKLDLLGEAREDSMIGGSIVWKERDECRPMKLGLFRLMSPASRIEVIDSIGFYRKIVSYRNRMLQLCGSYQWRGQSYHLDNIKTIRSYENGRDLRNKLKIEFAKEENMNSKEDCYFLMDIYCNLLQAGENWIFSRPTSLLTNLCILSTIEQDVLAVRALALAHWKSKVSTGEYAFNELLTIVDGPELVKKNSGASYKVSFAAIDREQKNEVKVESPENVEVIYNEDGTASFTLLNPSVGVHTIKGTIAVRNKSGVIREESWEKTIEVLR